MEETVKKRKRVRLFQLGCLRLLLASLTVIGMVLLPEEMPFRVDVLRAALMCLAVSILVYPAFSKAVRHTFLPKGMRYALTWCALCPLLWSSIVAIDLFYLDEFILAVAFFVIVLFLAVFWLLFEASLLQTKQPEEQQQLSLHKQYPPDASTSESSPFLTDSKKKK